MYEKEKAGCPTFKNTHVSHPREADHGDDGGDSVRCEVTDGEGSLNFPVLRCFHPILPPPTPSEAVDRGPRAAGVLSALAEAKSEGPPTSLDSDPPTLEPRRLFRFKN